MDTNQMQALGLQAINMLRATPRHGFVLMSYYNGEGARRMKMLEDLIVSKAGVEWLNDPHHKAHVMEIIRFANAFLESPEAMVFATAANMFVLTAKGEALPEAQKQKIVRAGHDRHHQAVTDGDMECLDCISASVQTPSTAMMVTHVHGEERPRVVTIPYAELAGNIRMYP